MDTFNLFYQIKEVHGLIAGVTFSLVILSDMYGLSWILNFNEKLNFRILHWLHKIVFVGLLGLILTGLSLVLLDNSYFTNFVFWLKMFFVTVLFLNAFRIGKEMDLPAQKTFKNLTKEEKRKMLIVGITSIFSWVSALILANTL